MRATTLTLIATAALAASGCDAARPHPSAGVLRLSPARVEFARTAVGHPVKARIALANSGALPLRVKLAVGAPFFVVPELELAAGERQEAVIEFAPQSAGEHWAELQVHTAQGSTSVALRGSAVAGAGCSAGLCPRADLR